MSAALLQVNFKFSVPSSEYGQMANTLADQFAAVPGLRWKVWIMNESESEAGGIYLFEDEAALLAYLAGPLAAAVAQHPALTDVSAKPFAVMDDATAITRGPV